MKEEKRLSLKEKIGYGLGDAGGVMTFALMTSTFSMYCTDALGIKPTTLAALLLIWNIWDFINDPLMGAFIDKSYARNRNNPKGKFRPWILRSTPLLCISFIVLWSVPSLFDGFVRLSILFCLKILYEGSYTMFNIPMGSLLSAMADTDEDRASLSSARGIGSASATLISLFIMPLFLKRFGEQNPMGYAIGASICALIGFAMCLAHYYLTNEKKNGTQAQESEDIKFTDILEVVKVNRPFVALCIHGVFICMMQYVGNTLSNYMYADVLGDISIAAYGTLFSTPTMLLIFIIGPHIAKKIGLEKLIRYGLLISCILYISLFGVLMVFELNPIIYAIWSNTAMGFAFISVYMQWGLVGEAIDYNEMITKKRTEGSIYGTFNLSRRVGQTIGNSAAVLLLGLIGYNGSLATQSVSTLNGIKVISVLLPGILVLGSWAAFKFLWNMDDEMRRKIYEFKSSGKA